MKHQNETVNKMKENSPVSGENSMDNMDEGWSIVKDIVVW